MKNNMRCQQKFLVCPKITQLSPPKSHPSDLHPLQPPLEQESVPVFLDRRIGRSCSPEKAESFYTGKSRITSLLSFPVSLYNKINNNA
jgi:hypothetical protein